MLTWSRSFLVIVIAGVMSRFSGTGSGATAIAPVGFLFFLAAFRASLIWAVAMARRSALPL